MKKALSFAVALGLVAGMASTAVATDITGTSRVRAVFQSMSQGDAQARNQNYDMRTRFMTKSQVADTVTVQTRMTLISENWGDGVGGDSVILDRAWITIKDQAITGGTWSYGRMPASWSKFFSWGGTKDRIKAMYALGDNKIGGFIQKSVELDTANADGDQDAYSLLFVGKAADTKYKMIAIRTEDDEAMANGDDKIGLMFDANVATKVGPASIEADLVYKGDDKFESADGGAQMGLQATATMAITDGITGAAIVAYGAHDFTADDDYTPSLLIGTSQVTAITDFGASQNTTAGNADNAYLVVLGAHIKVADPATLIVGAGQYNQSSESIGADGSKGISITEVDVAMKYDMAKNTTFMAGLAYGAPSNWSVDDDAVYSLGSWITTKW